MTSFPILSAQGIDLDLSAAAFGTPRDSSDLRGDFAGLRSRLEDEGYLYLRGFLPRPLLEEARAALLERLDRLGLLAAGKPPEAAEFGPGGASSVYPDLVRDNAAVRRVVFGPEIMGFYAGLFGGPVRSFDYVWARAIGRGVGTPPHCDVVYMGRGTLNLCTCWIPYGDVPLELGGLLLLENSHRQSERLRTYLARDVDAYCENDPADAELARQGKWSWPGHLSKNPRSLRERLGGLRWLAGAWHMGDFVTFKMSFVHGSLDNQTNRVRLSTDTRYQLAADPVDERWVGSEPVGHSTAGKRGRIC